ncbi:MAG: HAD-IIB family hydrolase [Janthinobacterium lividum]
MQALSSSTSQDFRGIRFVLTDMDETLTYRGRLAAATYTALERLQSCGIKVIPVTAAPAGWCDQMARMWPVDGVIAENGGIFLRRGAGAHSVLREYWHATDAHAEIAKRLQQIAEVVKASVPEAVLADDQVFRLTSIAFSRAEEPSITRRIVDALRQSGADTTVNNLWILGWLGGYDKLSMARRILAQVYSVDIDIQRDAILYAGDSTNDAPMFSFFKHTVGVSTVREYLPDIPVPPAWITDGPGGRGFVEVVDAIISAQQ